MKVLKVLTLVLPLVSALECVNDFGCRDPATPYCRGFRCVECRNQNDCPEQCARGKCVQCELDSHCESGTCIDNMCMQCTQTIECIGVRYL